MQKLKSFEKSIKCSNSVESLEPKLKFTLILNSFERLKKNFPKFLFGWKTRSKTKS